jgi:ADP-heptose:LPS heptosyltransferase
VTHVERQRLDLVLGSLFLLLLRWPVIALGKLLRLDHTPAVRGDLLIVKMQGGGSLVLAYTMLLGLRKRYPDRRLLLLSTPSVAPFAETLGVFDEILLIRDDGGLLRLLATTLRAWWRCFRVDTIIDLEVYSRLTTALSALAAARNRIGFYLESTFWRRGLHTHLIFFNRFSPVHIFYEQLARLVDAQVAPIDECASRLRAGLPALGGPGGDRRITIGHACSELGRERMLTPEQWLRVLRSRKVDTAELVFLGSDADRDSATAIIDVLRPHFPRAGFVNRCGELSLAESVASIDAADEFWGVDSGLLHYAWLLRTPTVSFWGPTDPRTRLRVDDTLDGEVYYNKVSCSPCIHVAENPPCGGDNVCIQSLFAGAPRCSLVAIRGAIADDAAPGHGNP